MTSLEASANPTRASVPARVHETITLLYDAACPLCSREVRLMTRFNRQGRVVLEDISARGFDAGRYGLTQEEVMGHLHAILPDGRAVTGMEAFRRCYEALGLGFLLAPTAWPGLKPLFDRGYAWFAKNRLRLTGRGHVCESETCAVHANSLLRSGALGRPSTHARA